MPIVRRERPARPSAMPQPTPEDKRELAARRLAIIRAVLEAFPPGRLLDLGTGHGQVAVLGHELGWMVTAVDARRQRMPHAEGIEWVESDVRAFAIDSADYDLIFILGLLYHLELGAQLALLRSCAGVPTLVDTHVAMAPDHREGGYEGQLFDELAGRSELQLQRSGTGSWGNTTSFWASEASQLQMFRDAGFRATFTLAPRYRSDRNFFLCM